MKIIQALIAKAGSVASAATQRISGQFNPLALSVSRSLAVFGKTFLGVSGFSFQDGQDVDKLAGRSVKRMQRVSEERKEKAFKHNQKEIEMLVGIQSLNAQQPAIQQENIQAIQQPAQQMQEQSFCSRIAQTKLPTITLQGENLALRGGDKDWSNKVSNHPDTHSGAMVL
jgi:hypothetical protein